MKIEQYRIIEKNQIKDFVDALISLSKVVAPVYKGYNNYAFQEIESADEVSLKYIPTIIPPKKYFLPKRETILQFDTKDEMKIEPVTEYDNLILFGVHTCDIAGIKCLNMVLSDRPKDTSYLIRKKHITIIGIECNDYCDEYASCSFVGAHMPTTGYDLMFTELSDCYIVHIHSYKGVEIVQNTGIFKPANEEKFEELKALRNEKFKKFSNEIPTERRYVPDLFDRSFNATVWKELEQKCLSCGNCTAVCPTCYCFNITDEQVGNTGERIRSWDSCMFFHFTLEASGHNPRPNKHQRLKNRVNHKFSYYPQKYGGVIACCGCGRCIRYCPMSVDISEIVAHAQGA